MTPLRPGRGYLNRFFREAAPDDAVERARG
ncbi:hypothetical protein BJY26_000873 [Spelaeicoccus albus]|uniref:Transposase n=1 Tax=Spelaeicoccus albus TaxID=1280376 RepID=A0A7Z0D1P6_9MICO|nr:hypothetical protein [Spelaeicoccus albus]